MNHSIQTSLPKGMVASGARARLKRVLGAVGLTLALSGASLVSPLSLTGSHQAAAAPLQLNNKKVSFKGGLKGELLERHTLPLVTLHLTFKTGSASDPAGKEGLANLMVEALRAGAGSRDAKTLAESLDALGAEYETMISRDGISLRLEVMSRDLPQAVALLSDLVVRPTYQAEEFERIRRQVEAGIKDRLDNPEASATVAFYEQLYQGHPYGHADNGNLKSVASISRDDVAKFHDATFRPENAWLIAIGDFKSAELKSLVDKNFGNWAQAVKATPALPQAVLPVPKAVTGQKVVLVHRAGLTQTQIRIGNLGVSANTPGQAERLIANTALGGGFTSRLVQEIRVNRSLSYGARSQFYSFAQPGPFLVTTFTKNETVGETIKVALETVTTFQEKGFQPGEFEKAQAYSVGNFAQMIQPPEGLANWLSRQYAYGLPEDFVSTYADKIAAVKVEQETDTLKRMSLKDRLIVVYADKNAVLDQLKPFGQVCVVDQVEFDASKPGECLK